MFQFFSKCTGTPWRRRLWCCDLILDRQLPWDSDISFQQLFGVSAAQCHISTCSFCRPSIEPALLDSREYCRSQLPVLYSAIFEVCGSSLPSQLCKPCHVKATHKQHDRPLLSTNFHIMCATIHKEPCMAGSGAFRNANAAKCSAIGIWFASYFSNECKCFVSKKKGFHRAWSRRHSLVPTWPTSVFGQHTPIAKHALVIYQKMCDSWICHLAQ